MSCPDCFKGHRHQDEPVGRVEVLYGRDTYIAELPTGQVAKGIIVILSNVMGWEFSNGRLLADRYAAQGYILVYLPDFMDGAADAVIRRERCRSWYVGLQIFTLVPFIFHNHEGKAYPKIQCYLAALHEAKNPGMSVSLAGFCLGGKLAALFTHAHATTKDGRPLADAVFIAHPAGLSVPSDVEKCVRPMSLAIGDKDMALSMKKDALKSEVVMYPGAGHGFASRFDPLNHNVAKQAAQADEQVLRWFAKNFQPLGGGLRIEEVLLSTHALRRSGQDNIQ